MTTYNRCIVLAAISLKIGMFTTTDLFDYSECQEKCRLMIIMIDKVKDDVHSRPIADFSKLLSTFRNGVMNILLTLL